MSGQRTLPASEASPLPWSVSGGAHGSAGIASRAVPETGSAPKPIDRAFELPDGYTIQFVDRADQLASLMELLVREGISQRFSRVAITIDREEEQFWVRISGPPEVKVFLRERVLCDTSRDLDGGET
ncbi:MAG: hypothetical protein ACE5GX_12145 [Thermoanaerobaculia bacterium]